MDETLVNAGQVSGEGSRTNESVIETNVDVNVNEGAGVSDNQQANVEPTKTEDKPQSKEDNAAWKQMRLEKEQAAKEAAQYKRDLDYTKKIGKEYGVFSEEDIKAQYGNQGIDSWEKFEQAVEDQRKQSDPDEYYKELGKRAEQERQQKKNQEENDSLKKSTFEEIKNKHINDFVNNPKYSDVVSEWTKNNSMPQEVIEAIDSGASLIHAYELYQKNTELAKLQTELSNKANAEAAMGSVTGKGSNSDGLISKEVFEANKNNPKWVLENHDKLTKSMKTWIKQ